MSMWTFIVDDARDERDALRCLARTVCPAMHDRMTAAEAERDALRDAQSTALSLLGEIIRDCNNTGLPNEIVADRVIERVEGWAMEARAALGGQP